MLPTAPPHSIEAEANVIGTMVVGLVSVDDVNEIIGVDDLYLDKHRALFDVVVELQRQERDVSLVSVKDALDAGGNLGWVSVEFLLDVADAPAAVGSWRHYAKEIRDLSTRRRMREAGLRMIERADKPQETVEDLLEETEQDVFAIRRDDQEIADREGLAKEAIEDILERCRNPGIRGVPTGFQPVDDLLGGYLPSTLNIIAALPSMGKTAYAMNVGVNVAAVRGPVLMFSLEMSRLDIARNAICCINQIDAERAQRGTLTVMERESFSTALAGPLDNMVILDPPCAKVGTVRAVSRRICARRPVSLIIVDYLQLMYSGSDSRYVQAGAIALGMKTLARELRVPVILLSQLSRGVWMQEDNRPNLSHLRDSGDIEAHADTVSFVHRPGYFKRESDDDRAEIIVAKNRQGRCGTAQLHFTPQHLRFSP